MRLLRFLTVVLVASFGGCNETYTSKFDSIDYHAILSSERLLKNYYNCLMELGPCTPDGKELKVILPDALKTECVKCSEKQKEAAKEIVDFVIKNKREWFNNLAAKYDPEGFYKEKYKDKWLEMGYSLD